MRYLNQEKGAALVTVIIAVLVLSLLGSTLLFVSSSEAKSVAWQQDQMQAYYLAWSGAKTVADYVLTNPDSLDMEAYLDELAAAGESDPVFIHGAGEFTCRVAHDSNTVTITSTGRTASAARTVKVTLHKERGWNFPPLDTAVFAYGKILLENNAKVNGHLGTNSSASGAVEINNNAEVNGDIMVGVDANLSQAVSKKNNAKVNGETRRLDAPREYVLPPFPDFPDVPQSGSLTVTANSTISGNAYYNTIRVKNNARLTVNVLGETWLRANAIILENNAELVLNGSGSLVLYVDNQYSVSNNTEVNKNGDSKDLFLYYNGSQALNINNNSYFNGSFYARTANVAVQNNSTVTGHVFCGGTSLVFENNTTAYVRVLFAPNAHVNLNNNVEFKGSIVGAAVTIDNNATVTYDPAFNEEPTLPGSSLVSYVLGRWE